MKDLRVQNAASAPVSPRAFVVIGRVRDVRVFQARPPRADIPSLWSEDELADRRITERAYGRLRGSFGNAQGDMVLPKGRTVPALVREVLEQAFKQRGYRLVPEHDPRASSAPRVDVTIERFWSYLRPGFWKGAVEFVTQLRVTGNLPGADGGFLVETRDQLRKGMITEAHWVALVEKGLGRLTQEISRKLPAPPPAAPPAWPVIPPVVQSGGSDAPLDATVAQEETAAAH